MSKFQDYVPQPFAIYKTMALHPDPTRDVHYQNAELHQCNGDTSTFQLVLPTDGTDIGFPAFIIRRPSGGASITSWTMLRAGGGGGSTVTLSGVTSSIEDLDDVPDWEAVIFPSQKFTETVLPGSFYWLRITDGTSTWYSEQFTFSESGTINPVNPYSTIPSPCGNEEWIQIGWSNPDCVISEKFPMGTGFLLNLAATVANPEYKYKPESEEDGIGGGIVTFQRLDKVYTFFVRAPEYIADALSAAQMFKYFNISFQYGDTMNCRNVSVEVDWKDACFADVKVSFEADFLVRTMCC